MHVWFFNPEFLKKIFFSILPLNWQFCWAQILKTNWFFLELVKILFHGLPAPGTKAESVDPF
jgi:hypothetical protein